MTPARPARAEHGAQVEQPSAVDRLEHAFQPWVAYAIMPLFALCNAGVGLAQIHFAGETTRVFLGVALGLVLGKPIGVIGLAWVAVRVRLARLPDGTSWTGMLVLGLIAGTGFTMSLFMTSVALDSESATGVARLAVLVASAIAAIAGILVGLVALERPQRIGLESARDTTP
jgi:NhaA family Na+:H+ antiporter